MQKHTSSHFVFKTIADYSECHLSKSIQFVNMGYEKCLSTYHFSNVYDYYRIYCIRSGRGTLTINNVNYTLSKNDAFLIRPNQFITKKADANDPWEYCFFAFNGKLAEKLIEQSLFQNQHCLCSLDDNSLCQSIVEATRRTTDYSVSELRGLELLFRFFQHLEPSSEQTSSASATTMLSGTERYYHAACEYIALNYYKPILIEDICQAVNASRSYLFRVFKQHDNSTVSDHLATIRLEHAKMLLLTTDHTVENIASAVGYLNPPSFYRMFKRREHMTPDQWRQVHLESTNK